MPVARPGRLAPYRGVQVELPAELAIPTCDDCGAETMSDALARDFAVLVETSYWAQRPGARRDATPTLPVRLPRR